jgi:hypothetical protein
MLVQMNAEISLNKVYIYLCDSNTNPVPSSNIKILLKLAEGI